MAKESWKQKHAEYLLNEKENHIDSTVLSFNAFCASSTATAGVAVSTFNYVQLFWHSHQISGNDEKHNTNTKSGEYHGQMWSKEIASRQNIRALTLFAGRQCENILMVQRIGSIDGSLWLLHRTRRVERKESGRWYASLLWCIVPLVGRLDMSSENKGEHCREKELHLLNSVAFAFYRTHQTHRFHSIVCCHLIELFARDVRLMHSVRLSVKLEIMIDPQTIVVAKSDLQIYRFPLQQRHFLISISPEQRASACISLNAHRIAHRSR